MFILKPIHKKIQKRLMEKQNWMMRLSPKDIEDEMGRFKFQATSTGGAVIVPNPLDFESDLNDNQIFTRTTWIRMSSANKGGMISIVGGEMGQGEMRWGGPTAGGDDDTSLYRKKDTSLPEIAIVNEYGEDIGGEEYPDRESSWRPVAGIKSLSSEYQNYSIRNTTINWIAWDYESINELTPFFLSNGASVLIEWGWSNKSTGLSGQGPIEPANFTDAYIKLQDRIFESRGDYDAVAGMVKNFQWKTRDDGGFDCTTELTSMGVNILEQSIPGGSGVSDAGAGWNVPKDTESDNVVIPVDLQSIYNNRFENFLEDLDVQLDFMYLGRTAKNYNFLVAHQSGRKGDTVNPFSEYKTNYKKEENENSRIGPYVTWGWMEDNLLNRFFGQTSAAEDPVLEIRSILPKLKDDGEKMKYTDVDSDLANAGKIGEILIQVDSQRKSDNINSVDATTKQIFESCKCINSPALLTTDPKRFILKGQWPDISAAATFKVGDGTIDDQIKIGAKEWEIKETYKHIQGDTTTPPRFLDFAVPDDDNSGYIRNIILHWSIIQDAFGGAGSLTNGFNNLFAMLNAESGGIWDFELVVDENNGGRSIVIDKNHSTGKIIPMTGDPENDAGTKSIDEDYKHDGLFVFPVFSTNSIVKSQNIETNISSEMGTMLMLSKYGNPIDRYDNIIKIQGGKVNADILGTLFNPFYLPDPAGEKAIDLEAYAAQHMNPYFDGLQSTKIAQLGIKYGNNSGTPNDPLRKESGFAYDPKTIRSSEWNAIATEIQNNLFGNSETDEHDKSKLYQNLVKELQKIDIDVQDLQFETTELPASLYMMYNKDGVMTGQWKMIMHAKLSKSNVTGIAASINPTVPLEISLELDGTGGIFPGNSFHTNYVPETYRKWCCFQCSSVEHSVDSSGWTTTIKGLMTIFIDKLKAELTEMIATAAEEGKLSEPEIAAQALKDKKGKEAGRIILGLMETYKVQANKRMSAVVKIDLKSEKSWDWQFEYYKDQIGNEFHTSSGGRAAANSNKKYWTWQGELEGSWGDAWINVWNDYWNFDANMGDKAVNGNPTDHDDANTYLWKKRKTQGGGSSINNALYRISNAIAQGGQGGSADLACGFKWQQKDGVYARSGIITDLQWLMGSGREIYLQIESNGSIWNPLYVNQDTGKLWYDTRKFKTDNSILHENHRLDVQYKIYLGPFDPSSQASSKSKYTTAIPRKEWWEEGSTYPRRIDPLSVGGLQAKYLSDGPTKYQSIDAEAVKSNEFNPTKRNADSRKSAWIGLELEYLYDGPSMKIFKSPDQWFGKLKNLKTGTGFPKSNTSHYFRNKLLWKQTMERYKAYALWKGNFTIAGVRRTLTLEAGSDGLVK